MYASGVPGGPTVGYEPLDDSEVVYADEIRELMLEPARQDMVKGEAGEATAADSLPGRPGRPAGAGASRGGP